MVAQSSRGEQKWKLVNLFKVWPQTSLSVTSTLLIKPSHRSSPDWREGGLCKGLNSRSYGLLRATGVTDYTPFYQEGEDWEEQVADVGRLHRFSHTTTNISVVTTRFQEKNIIITCVHFNGCVTFHQMVARSCICSTNSSMIGPVVSLCLLVVMI